MALDCSLVIPVFLPAASTRTAAYPSRSHISVQQTLPPAVYSHSHLFFVSQALFLSTGLNTLTLTSTHTRTHKWSCRQYNAWHGHHRLPAVPAAMRQACSSSLAHTYTHTPSFPRFCCSPLAQSSHSRFHTQCTTTLATCSLNTHTCSPFLFHPIISQAGTHKSSPQKSPVFSCQKKLGFLCKCTQQPTRMRTGISLASCKKPSICPPMTSLYTGPWPTRPIWCTLKHGMKTHHK